MTFYQKAGHNLVAVLLFLLMLFVGVQSSLAASADDPLTQVKDSVEAILQIVRDSKSQPDGKVSDNARQQIIDLVYSRFDFRIMSQLALSETWKTMNNQEQDHFAHLFAKLLENTYYDRITSYSDEEVIFKEQLVKNKRAVVSCVVMKNNVEIPMVYKLWNRDGNWLIYDVIIEGVSIVRNYQTQFASILEKEQYSGLLKRLEGKVARKELN